jgi:hypothetical protein
MKRLAGNPNPFIITEIYLDVKIYSIKVYERERREARRKSKREGDDASCPSPCRAASP